MSEKIGIFPGSFDPMHNGHLDLVERSRALFDRLVVAVLHNESKRPVFTVEERVEMIREVVGGYDDCRVESFSGLLVRFVQQQGGVAVVRGLRGVTDFEYELQMTMMNRRLDPGIETVFLMPDERYSRLSSSLVKEVCALGGSVEGLLPPTIAERLTERLASPS